MRRSSPRLSRSAVGVRLVMGVFVAAALAFTTLQAQIPGRNVNMVSGVTLPDGDPYLQRQNEPSMAASTRNPLHLLGGSNDYRTVDLPGLPGSEETGDAWLGLYKSADGGQRWTSTLLPGYPQEPAGEGLDAQGRKSPLFTGGYKAAADPVVRAGTNGLFYYAGLSFDRGENGKSAIFLARFVDNNNREDRDATAYLGTGLVATATGTDGRFLDKPWMAVDIPRGGNPGTCRIETPGEFDVSPTGIVTQELPVVQIVPAGTVYVAYTSFFGPSDDRRSEILLTRSFDCGVSWQAPMRVSRAEDPINQGVSIAIDPKNGHVYVAWRRFSRPSTPGTTTPALDGIMFAKLPAGGRKFNPPGVARRFPKGQKKGLQPERFSASRTGKEIDQLNEFDQATGEFKFRTNAYPAMAVDGTGRAYLAWSERGFATFRSSSVDGDARIVMATTTDGNTFTAPRAIDNSTTPNDPTVTELVGHQVMPSVAFAGGKIMVAYYDLRETKAKIFGPQITDANLQIRNTIDIRAAMAQPGDAPEFAPSVKVSEYMTGFRNATSPREQLQFNPPNLPMFKQGTVPFMGDYIDLAPAPAFVPTGKGRWAFNTAATAALPTFHAVWTDNRDVRAPTDGDWTKYGPPTSAVSVQACVPGTAGSRNQNIYTSRIAGGLFVGSPGNAKPLSATVQRGFVVFAQNATTQTRTFRMTILNQPPGGRASFDQFPRSVAPALRTSIDLRVLPRSTASRTVYITSTDPRAQVAVDTSEIAAVGGAEVAGGLEGVVVLNPDIENPDIENPDIENPDIENPDIENAEVYNPDIENPDIENPDIENPDIENPDIENPDIENPDIENPDIENIVIANPDIENPDIENPDIENPDIENPDIENPDIENVTPGDDNLQPGVLTDITWNVTNTGNTTAAFNVNLFLANTTLPAGLKTQLILHKTYRTPAVNPTNCLLAYESRTIVVANIPRPEFVRPTDNGAPDQNDPSEKNATLWLGPGEVGKVTLRVYDAIKSDNDIIYKEDGTAVSVDPAFNPQTTVTPTISSQGVGTLDKNAGKTDPPLVTPTGANLFFLQMPSAAVAGAAIAPPVSVQVRDNLTGTPVAGATVTLALGNNPGAASLNFNTAVTGSVPGVDLGIATFPGLSVSAVGSGYTLVASATTAGVAAAAVSTLFDVVAPLAVTTTAIPDGIAGLVYVQTLQSSGGAGTTRTWSLAGGALPPGLTLEATTGKITGTLAPATRGSFAFTVQVTDSAVPPHADTQSLSLLVTAQADLSVTVTDAPDPVNVGQAVTYTIETTNTGPSTATNFSVVDSIPASAIFVSASTGCTGPTSGQLHCPVGTLAPGATASVTIVLRPTSPGSLNNQVSATALEADPNSANNTATASTWVQSSVNIGVPSQSERTAQKGVPFALSLTASGGAPPYSWSLVDGALPLGLSLNGATGVISGTATTVGPCTFTVRAQDTLGAFATRTLCIDVVTPPVTSLTTGAVGDAGLTIADLVTSLLGQGVAVSNITLNGLDADQLALPQYEAMVKGAGTFEGGASTLGFDRGIILSSGNVNLAKGPNDSDSTTASLGTPGDPDLSALAGQPTSDATIIQFDFVPTGNQVSFRYVFGSEEYNEFVATQFNDVFGFFIKGPNDADFKNWALVPGTTLPVAINTINGGNEFSGVNASHPTLYRNNDLNNGGGLIDIEADGLTVVLTLTATVTPGESHRMKLAIADAGGDSAFDSWVFIEGGSFRAVENCSNGADDDGDGLIDGADSDCSVCLDPAAVAEPVMVTVPGTAGGLANVNAPPSGTAPVAAFTLAAGQTVTASAAGGVTWYSGPTTSDPNGAPIGTDQFFLASSLAAISLVARINGGPWQFVGTGPTILGGPGISGLIEFAVNDSHYQDNGGAFTVTIQP